MDLEQLEALALSDDRTAALAGLLPGTPEHDYWRGVHLQHRGQLADVETILSTWKRRHGRHDEHYSRLRRRQLLLVAGRDLEAHADRIRFEAGLRLDDEAEAVAAAQRHPTRLDPAILDEAALLREALHRGPGLHHVTDWALADLTRLQLDAATRRNLLQRLTRVNIPGLVNLIAADLDESSSRGFGSLSVHHRLTLPQLVELEECRPDLRNHPQWVGAVLTRLRPPAHIDWRTDLDARRAYLDTLWTFADALSPAFNALKAQILYHRLDLDRRLGVYDRERFLRYLALPRRAHYVRADWLRTIPGEHQIAPNAHAAQAAGLEPVGDDELLVREFLAHFLLTEDGRAFAEFLRADWLDEQLATVRLLAGAPETERWAALLGPARLAALRDRVDIELTARNPAKIPADAPVALEVELKNVPQLVVKTYRIDPVAYFLARGAEVDTSIDLDGMVASDEQVLRSDLPPIRRERRTIPLPGCARPGTYIVELIGNGKSSRALIRKGALRYTVRVGVAGPTIRVLDEQGRPLENARIWLGGREFAPRDDGAISIPFSTAPGRPSMLLVHGDIAQVETLQHPAEHYQFSAGLHLERESLVPGKTARCLIRPMLTVAGWPAPVALIDDPRAEIHVTDRAGTTSTTTQPLALRDDAETVVELRVPEDAAEIGVTVRGSIRVVSTQKTIDVSDDCTAEIGLIHAGEHTEAFHLSTTDAGHCLYLLGKTGEPRAGRAVALTFKHIAVGFEVATTLETDARGRIELGPLTGVERLTASLPSGVQQSFRLWPDVDPGRTIHAVAGAPLRLPRPPGAGPQRSGNLTLVELRGGAPYADVTDHITLDDRTLELAGDLAPGEYLLQCRGAADVRLVVVPADAPRAEGWALAGPTSLELSPPAPVLTALAADADHLLLRLHGAGPLTRVHLLATAFRPECALPRGLARAPRPPLAGAVAPVLSQYLSGRDIGDEYRYVLERRHQPRRPGVLLDKPGLLLNPWALRTTTTGVQQPKSGGVYGPGVARPAAAPAPTAASPQITGPADRPGFANLDFLPAAAVVLANLRPDERGELRVPLAELGQARHVRVLVVDPALTTVADLGLPDRELRPRDLRLRLALQHDAHFAEDRRIEAAPAGTTLVVDDVRSDKLELVDTTARAHQMLLALGAPDTLREFAFVAQWHTLDDATRRARYSKYACHELHLFLYFRDPDFFARVVRPYLAHKRHKTFVDRWLLGDDLSAYLEPWAFGRLNALERALLARRVPAARDAIARLLADAVDLIPPDPERDARLVDALLGTTALEGSPIVAAAAPMDDGSMEDADFLLDELEEEKELAAPEPAPKERSKKSAPPRRARGALVVDDDEAPVGRRRSAPRPPSPAAPAPGGASFTGGYGGGFDLAAVTADLRERERAAPLFRGADKTQEWAESDWWHVRVADAGPDLIPVNRYWRDFAHHDPASGPFLSPYLGECTTSFAAALCALAVLDLPFVAGTHSIAVDDARLTLTCAGNALAARTRITAIDAADVRSAILVGQSYFRADDRWEWDGPEQREKYVDGELLTGVVYQCQVVVTNPTSRNQKLAVLLQIPRGAMPVASGFYTRTVHMHLGPYGTEAVEYAFYFPAPGRFTHFPAHVTRAGELVAFAAPTVLDVVHTPTRVDATSWAHVSQHGTTDEVLAFLERANLGRIELEKIAWRMKDRDAFDRVLALLSARHVYCDRLWAYALVHGDHRRVGEWLRHQDDFLRPAGPVLEGGVIDLDPVERAWYQHLEYAPLIGARAHQLGARRQILNDGLAAQYRAFLDVVAHRPAPTPDDLLAAAHYLFSLDRIDDALAALARIDPARLATRLQYDYLAAYAACCRGDLAAARTLATPWKDHPVDRWRHRFAALIAMLDEAEGRGPALAVDADSRDQRMNELAARQPTLELTADKDRVVLQHTGLVGCQLRFYRMDIELLFSRQPFVQRDVERFSWIEPGAAVDVALTGDGRTIVEIPPAMRGANLVIDAVAPGLRRSITHYAHDLATQLAHQYGQLRVLRASTQTPLPAAYVKVYARQRGGAVVFYKDGYTDLRGRFDYVTLSTDDLDRVERFAILVVADDAGATVLEAAPPPR